ncbi:MAG: fused MFS/spermidine synthase [Candidatus Aureabacteria bacterium]|nr:fused MFS/spermidine synthase [Candidatus Auribacterota bacterium]
MRIKEYHANPDRAKQALPYLYYIITWLGAYLLFSLELMTAQKLLPLFGGSFSIWAACMMFFQIFLLLGYYHGHYITSFFLRKRAFLHLALLLLSLMLFPISFPSSGNSGYPIFSIGILLLKNIGLSFMLLSATTILQHKWLSASGLPRAKNPYVLYTFSNFGSFFAILIYPFLIQPFFTLTFQFQVWQVLYFLYVMLHFFCLPGKQEEKDHEHVIFRLLIKKYVFLWIWISMGTSSLLIAVTNIISMDISPAPFLWIFPLAGYLLSFVFAFSEKKWLGALNLFSAGVTVFLFIWVVAIHPHLFYWILFFNSFLFTFCLLSHRLLVKLKPVHHGNLSLYYILIAAGGCMGSMLVNFGFPVIMRHSPSLLADIYFAMLLVSGSFAIHSLRRWKLFLKNPYLAGLSVGLVLNAALVLPYYFFKPEKSLQELSFRNFYGITEIRTENNIRYLYHGSTLHGAQLLSGSGKNQMTPLYYYRENGPFGDVFKLMRNKPGLNVAALGLGTGGMLGYSRQGENWDYYEINPDIIYVAKNYFTYISQSRAHLRIIEGDARIEFMKSPNRYDLMLLDAYNSDAIPVHLITREAMGLYLKHLAPEGVMVFHVSNRYFKLIPVLTRLADSFHLFYASKSVKEGKEDEPGVEVFAATASKSIQDELKDRYGWTIPVPDKSISLWTDEQINLFEALSISSLKKA